jgi:hypothetical protein
MAEAQYKNHLHTAQQERRWKVARLYLQGKAQVEIGQLLGVTQACVSMDLAAIRKVWVEEAQDDYIAARARELAKIDHLESVAWEAWDRSTKDAEVRTTKKEKAPRVPTGRDGRPRRGAKPKLGTIKFIEDLRVTGQSGNPAFLDRVAWCIEMRSKLLGLVQPDKKQVNNFFINWEEMYGKADDKDDPIEAEIASVGNKALPPSTNGQSHEA